MKAKMILIYVVRGTKDSHDGFYKFRHNYSTGACYYKKIKNELEFYFKIKDVEPIKENEIDNYYMEYCF